jgi:hypothetical protein
MSYKAARVPEFKREERGVVLLMRAEAQAIFDFLIDHRGAMIGKPQALYRAANVLARQLEWIRQQDAISALNGKKQ